MMFFCSGCQKDRDFETEFAILIIQKWGDGIIRFCRECRSPRSAVPDVYWDGKPEGNLADDPVTGQPRVFLSRGQKAAYLKERGLMEAGDRVHGAPVMFHKEQVAPRKDTRHEVRMALKRVREMGRDVRRQQYLRIVREGQRAEA